MALYYRVPSFPIESHLHDLAGLEQQLGGWAAGLTCPVRLIARSRPFDMRPAIQALRQGHSGAVRSLHQAAEPLLERLEALAALPAGQAGAALPAERSPWAAWRGLDGRAQRGLGELFGPAGALGRALALEEAPLGESLPHWRAALDALRQVFWPVPLIKEQTRFLETLERHAFARSIEHTLIAWPDKRTNPAAIGATLSSALGREVKPLDQFPAVLGCPYELDEWRARLRPLSPGHPWLAIIHAYDARGRIDARLLHPLLDRAGDLVLAVDIQTLPRHRAMRAAEMAYATAKVIQRDASVKDVGAERKFADAEQVMHALQDQQSLHEVRVAALVAGETEEALETHLAEVIGQLGSALRFTRVAGAQGLLLQLFSPTPTGRIAAPIRSRNYLSAGVGCLLGVWGFHRASRTDGLLWGIDDVRASPIFFNPFGARNEDAAHMVVLGKSGFGKTFFLNVMTLRAAALAGHRVIWIDAFENGYRVARAVGAGARCYPIGLEQTINLLDCVYTPAADGPGWRSSQVQHVIAALALLMGTPALVRGADQTSKKERQPRAFDIAELGALDRALSDLYDTVDPYGSLEEMPTLRDLIDELEISAEPAAQGIAYALRMLLFGTRSDTSRPTTMGRAFNGVTTVDWGLQDDVTCFDLTEVEKGAQELLPLYYAQLIGAIYRDMRNPRRDRLRRTFLVIDEFGLAAKVEAVAMLAATMTKVARKFGYAMVVVDQNPDTFLHSPYGRAILENAAGRILFHLDDAPARQMAAAISDLTPVHLDYLIRAQKGRCVAVFGNTVYAMAVQASALEQRLLQGS